MYMYMHVHVCTCMYIYIHAYGTCTLHVHAYTCIWYMYMHTCTHSMYNNVYTCIYIYMHCSVLHTVRHNYSCTCTTTASAVLYRAHHEGAGCQHGLIGQLSRGSQLLWREREDNEKLENRNERVSRLPKKINRQVEERYMYSTL